MGCLKNLTIAQATPTGGDDMIHDAVYVGGAVDKIFATSGPWVIKFNATTGARESAVRIGSPLYGESRICYHAATGMIYAAFWNTPNEMWFGLPHPYRDVFPINPTTMVVGAGLGLFAIMADDFTGGCYQGPRWIGSAGNYLHILWAWNDGGITNIRINPSNVADRDTTHGRGTIIFWIEQCALSATEIYVPEPGDRDIYKAILGYTIAGDWDYADLQPHNPIGVEFCGADNKPYVVNGDNNVIRIDTFANSPTIQVINLDNGATIAGTPGGTNPCRARYNSVDGLMYFPCSTANGIAVLTPGTGTGVWKSGFDNPIDCVFTGSKAFAVQQAAVALKEIT